MSADSLIPVFALYGETELFAELVHVEPISARSAPLDWRINAHRHAAISQFFLIEDGGGKVLIDGAEIELGAGQFAFIPAQVVHAFEFEPDTAGLVVSVPSHFLGTIGPAADGVARALVQACTGTTTPELYRLCTALEVSLTGRGPLRLQKALGLGFALLASVAETQAAPSMAGRTQQRLARLADLVRMHMEDGWGLAEYARAMSVSPGHLSRLCRASAGTGAQAFIERVVIEEACRHLAFTDLPVAEIGYLTGFSDPSYFSKRFRAATGTSPRQYRARIAQPLAPEA